jgi:uncharacterized repeat protein (TIGR02543 family)
MVFLILIVGGTMFSAVQGFLAVEAIDGVQVYVNGEMKGITVGGSSVLMLDPGSYRITLEKEGYSSTSQTVTIKAGEATNLKVNMTKPQVRGEALGADDKTVVLGQKTGTVEIRSVPFRGADIQINGVNYGQTDRRLTNMPVGPIRVYVTYAGKRLYGTFEVKENRTTQLQANYAMDPAQIIQLYDATFVLPDLPEGVKAELVGAYGTGIITSGQQTRVMGPKHTVRYTNGEKYIEFKQEIDLEESTYVRLQTPDSAFFASILPSYTVSFDSGGGNPILPIANVKQGMRISSPIKPMRTGYTFEGWYKESSLVNEWDFAQDTVLKDMTLYAKWSKEFTLSEASIPLTYVEGGLFQMGSTSGRSNEKPVHTVTVGSFYMGTYEISQDIYEEVMESNPSYFTGARLPVESVNWYHAVVFANALSRRDRLEEVYTISGTTVSCDWSKRGYRLPTEAEWEYAARGGNRSRGYTYAGSDTLEDVAWYFDISGRRTHKVGGKAANELGLHDMSGNVWEWCWDWYGTYSAVAQTNPTGPSSGSKRVLRGGGWNGAAAGVHPAYRTRRNPSDPINIYGFRLVLPAE